MINVRDAMRRAAQWNKQRPAVMSDGKVKTFEEMWDRGVRLANGMLSLGIKPGDRVAVLEENSLEAADFFVAGGIANIIRVPLYKLNAPEAHVNMLQHTGCTALIVSMGQYHEIEQIKDQIPFITNIIVRDEKYESWLAAQSNVDPNIPISLDDFHIIRHSGGTTGFPKGMGFTHRMWMNMTRDWVSRMPTMEAGDCATHVAPISHGSGYIFTPIWMAGGCNILERKFDAEKTLNTLSKHGGYFFAVPTMLSDMLAHARGKTWSFPKLKAIACGASPILPETALASRELFGHCLHQIYGQTEATPAVWMTPDEWFGTVEGSEPLFAAGKVMPFAQVEIRDENNLPVPAGEVGEVALQTDGQVDGVWGDPEQTAERWVDDWVLTRDMGRIDENGYLYLVDRKDDMIISGGFNIWPAEMENMILQLPEVREVAIIRAPHKRWGETPIAIVVLHDGATLDEAAVIDICATRLGSLKRPTEVHFRQELLPRSAVGKVNRKLLREAFWASTGREVGGS